LRIHDYGIVRLHIHEFLLDLFHALQGKFLGFFAHPAKVDRLVFKTMAK